MCVRIPNSVSNDMLHSTAADYTIFSIGGQLNFNDGQQVDCITVQGNVDLLEELGESFTIRLSDPVAGGQQGLIINPADTVVTIIDTTGTYYSRYPYTDIGRTIY